LEAFKRLHSAGQNLWMSHVSREQISNGSLMQYIEDGAVTGLSLSLQAVCHTLSSSSVYDDAICKKLDKALFGESLAFDLILEDIHHAAGLLWHVFDRTDGVDGWAALPLSPLLTCDPETLLQSVEALHARVKWKNTLITIPGLPEMLRAIEEIVFAGIPINISFIYSCDQYLNVAEAYLCGVKRRIAAGLKPAVSVFTSIPVSQLAATLSKKMTPQEATRASTLIARKIYKTMRTLHTSQQWEQVYNVGARILRPVWVVSDNESTTASDISLCNNLVTPLTVAAMSERTMGEFVNHGPPEALLLPDDYDLDAILAGQQEAGLSFKHLAGSLQDDAAASQIKTWITLLDVIARKSADSVQIKSATMTTGEH